MVAAGVIFTNDRYPRACAAGADALAPSEPTADTLHTTVCEGATIGAGAVIGPGIIVGAFAMVGMGAVVVANVPPQALVYGNPARVHGYVCICGSPLQSAAGGDGKRCTRCRKTFELAADGATLRLSTE